MDTSELPIKSKRKKGENVEYTKKKRRISLSEEVEQEKIRLEKLVLGDASYMLRNLSESGKEKREEDDSGLEDEEGEDKEGDQFSDTLASPPRHPAWHDEADQITVGEAVEMQGCRHTPVGGFLSEDYQSSLRRKFEAMVGTPTWARLDHRPSAESQNDPDDTLLLRSCGNMLDKKRKDLTKCVLDIKRLSSLNCATRTEGRILKSVQFHPRSTVALVAGLSGVASIVQVDGQGNNKLASVRFDNFPVHCARFSADGSEFIVGSQSTSHFFTYDMMEGTTLKIPTHHNMQMTNTKKFEVSPDGKLIAVLGRFGDIHLLAGRSKEWITTLKMNGNAISMTFNSDGSQLYSTQDHGEVYVWDMSRRACSHKFFDEGCLVATSIAVSPCDKLVAIGSSSGVVNLYERESVMKCKNPSPAKAFMNLVTPCNSLAFNQTTEILAMGSSEKDNQIKLVHFPSMTVFRNFPFLNSDLNRVQGCTFSPSSGYMSVINNKSTAYLYRLRHYGNY